MLRVTANTSDPGSSLARRSFLQVGALGVGGLTLPAWSRLQAEPAIRSKAGRQKRHSVLAQRRARTHGNLGSQAATPGRVSRSARGDRTNVPGVQFGELMPEAGEAWTSWPILRTVNHGSGDHTKGNHWMLTGFEGPAFNAPDNQMQRRPAMGSAVARCAVPIGRACRLRRRAAPPRRHRQPLPLRGLSGRRRQPVHRQLRPERADFAVRNLSLAGDLTLERLEDRRTLRATRSACGPAPNAA